MQLKSVQMLISQAAEIACDFISQATGCLRLCLSRQPPFPSGLALPNTKMLAGEDSGQAVCNMHEDASSQISTLSRLGNTKAFGYSALLKASLLKAAAV